MRLGILVTVLLVAAPAAAQEFTDGSERALSATQTALVTTLFSKSLMDPGSAQIKGLRLSPEGAICGEMNARNTYGGYTGFRPFFIRAGENTVSFHDPSSLGADEITFNVLYQMTCP